MTRHKAGFFGLDPPSTYLSYMQAGRTFRLLTLIIIVFCKTGIAQVATLPSVQTLTTGTRTSLRGLSVVSDNVVWVSGSNGTVGRSSDGGKEWKWMTVKGFEKVDFRDIEAFDATTAVIMGTSEPAYILRTVDAGESWQVVFEDKTPGMFLDAMEFWNEQSGIVIGDPLNGRFFFARTFDGGKTWMKLSPDQLPMAEAGEACFAASGTNIRALDNDEAVFVSGGKASSIFIRDHKTSLPLLSGETLGANSIAVWDRFQKNGGNHLVVVGGDFNNPKNDSLICFFSRDRGKTWIASMEHPHGYRSCVEFVNKKTLVTCGLSGVDYSTNGAETWEVISNESFHVCRRAKSGKSVYLAGPNGRVAKLVKAK